MNRLLPLADHLLGPRRDLLDQRTRLVLVGSALRSAALMQRRTAQLGELAAEFERTGQPWLVLKGVPLAERLYPTVACRLSTDVDLLVALEAIPAADDALKRLGYRRLKESVFRLHHAQYERGTQPGDADIVELHWASDPPTYGPPPTARILGARRRFASAAGVLWIPGEADERDLLVRHYVRHFGSQAILLLDLLLHVGRGAYAHPLGGLLLDDVERLGLSSGVTGRTRLRQWPLRRWLSARDFASRLQGRPVAYVSGALALAMAGSPRQLVQNLTEFLWPPAPPATWEAAADRRWGSWTWRLRRLWRFGR